MLRKKVTKPGWIICIESKGKGIKEQLKNLTNGLKQKLNLKRYKKKVNQSRQNRLFQPKQSNLYQELDRK